MSGGYLGEVLSVPFYWYANEPDHLVAGRINRSTSFPLVATELGFRVIQIVILSVGRG